MTTLWSSEETMMNQIMSMLSREYGYPSESFQRQVHISYGKARYVIDAIVYVDNHPHILVEVKKTGDLISYKNQMQIYSEIVKPRYIILTNGISTYYYEVKLDGYQIVLNEIPDLPYYGETMDDIGKHGKNELYSFTQERLYALLWKHLDLMRVENYGIINSIKYLFTIYAAKYFDEVQGKYVFKTHYNEDEEVVKAKILSIVNDFYNAFNYIQRESIPLNAKIIVTIVYDLQRFSLVNSTDLFNSLLPNLLDQYMTKRGRLGEMMTPDSLSSFIIEVLQPKSNETFLDPACGIGGLLIKAAMKGSNAVGLAINNDVAQITNLFLIISGRSGKCFNVNSYISRNGWDVNVQDKVKLNNFDVIATSPPFGYKVYDHEAIDYELSIDKTRISSEALFIELMFNYLKDGGRGAIIVTSGTLFNASSIDVRKYLVKRGKLRAIIYLYNRAFSPYTNVNACILIFEKSDEGTKPSDEVFLGKIINNDYEKMLNNVKNFLAGRRVEETTDIMIQNINSVDNLDFNYLKGLRSNLKMSKSEYFELGQIAEITTGSAKKRIGNVDSKGMYQYINVKNIDDGIVNLEGSDLISLNKTQHKYVAHKNDIVISRLGDVGRAAIINEDNDVVVGNNLIKIKITNELFTPEYVLGFLLSNKGQQQINMYSGGSTINSINQNNLRKVKILYNKDTIKIITEIIRNYIDFKIEQKEIVKKIEINKRKKLNEINKLFGE